MYTSRIPDIMPLDKMPHRKMASGQNATREVNGRIKCQSYFAWVKGWFGREYSWRLTNVTECWHKCTEPHKFADTYHAVKCGAHLIRKRHIGNADRCASIRIEYSPYQLRRHSNKPSHNSLILCPIARKKIWQIAFAGAIITSQRFHCSRFNSVYVVFRNWAIV